MKTQNGKIEKTHTHNQHMHQEAYIRKIWREEPNEWKDNEVLDDHSYLLWTLVVIISLDQTFKT